MADEHVVEEWTPCMPKEGTEEQACQACSLKKNCPYPALYTCPTMIDILNLRAKRVNKIRSFNLPQREIAVYLGKSIVGLKFSLSVKGRDVIAKIANASYDYTSSTLRTDVKFVVTNRHGGKPDITKETLNISECCNALGIFDTRKIRAEIIKVAEQK